MVVADWLVVSLEFCSSLGVCADDDDERGRLKRELEAAAAEERPQQASADPNQLYHVQNPERYWYTEAAQCVASNY